MGYWSKKMSRVSIRYIVNDVDEAIKFYTGLLGFIVAMHPAPTFAILDRGDLRLLLSAPSEEGGGGKILPDGTKPEPGGWNRFELEVDDLDAVVKKLNTQNVHFRNEIVQGVAGRQILLEDPSSNLIELFEYYPTRGH
jgi:catechol 2,3-dioxygenase-like lactoylglutathione lyase family enzyme